MIGHRAVDIPVGLAPHEAVGRPRRSRLAAWRKDRRFLTAVTLTLAAFVAAEVAGHVAPGTAPVATLRLLALLFALLGAAEALERSYRERAREAESMQATADATRAVWEERAHEARSALSAIELAVYAATRRAGGSGVLPGGVEELVRTEVALLRRLLDHEATAVRTVEVAGVVHQAVAVERLHGSEIEVDVPAHLTARACPLSTTEIIRNLVENARRHAPGAAVRISARSRRGTVEVRVEDDGPGIPAGLRNLVFDRGTSGGGNGSGLGLYIARRLAESQGGTLDLARRRRGTAITLTLPEAEVLAGVA